MQNTIKHAPGPWSSGYCGKDTIKIFKPSDKRRIATVKVKTGVLDEANARLIATAPELLEALESLLLWDDGSMPGDKIEEARAAIAKAKGA